jgi:nucleoside-diphosphate-sugar epimerase
MGYIGPGVVAQLRVSFPDARLLGYDMSYFAPYLTGVTVLPESKLDVQIFGDVRTVSIEQLKDVDVVVHLAAISNDPMGSRYEKVTMDINYSSSIRLAQLAKKAGVRAFVFASSCSIYGAGGDDARTESSTLNPLTAYARSKVLTERDLEPLADDEFTVTCLRFATACGMSDRLRLDLVLNDFVASAVASGKINILSDGSPWRPLVHVKDMARAIEWAISRDAENGGPFLCVNTGSNSWNLQVKDLANIVARSIPGTEIRINETAAPDKRSYRVNFSLFERLAPNHQPIYTLKRTIRELENGLTGIDFRDIDFRSSLYIRLKVLLKLEEEEKIDGELKWRHASCINSEQNKFQTI